MPSGRVPEESSTKRGIGDSARTYGRCTCGTLVRVSPMTYTHGETGEPMRLASCPSCHVIVAEGHGMTILNDWQSLAS